MTSDSDIRSARKTSPMIAIFVMGRALRSAEAGDYASALKDYLWCWDEGHHVDIMFGAVRVSFLKRYLSQICEVYPDARIQLGSRLTSLNVRLTNGDRSPETIRDLNVLEQILSDVNDITTT